MQPEAAETGNIIGKSKTHQYLASENILKIKEIFDNQKYLHKKDKVEERQH